MPSLGTDGDRYDNSMRESIWSSMQIQLLNRNKWHTPVDLANTMFEKLGDVSPIDRELPFTQTSIPARSSHRRTQPSHRAHHQETLSSASFSRNFCFAELLRASVTRHQPRHLLTAEAETAFAQPLATPAETASTGYRSTERSATAATSEPTTYLEIDVEADRYRPR